MNQLNPFSFILIIGGIVLIIGMILIAILIFVLIRFLSNKADNKTSFGFYSYYRMPGFLMHRGGVKLEIKNKSFVVHTIFSSKKEILFKDVKEVVYGEDKLRLPYLAFHMKERINPEWHFLGNGFGSTKDDLLKIINLLKPKAKIREIKYRILTPLELK
jgi:hypothetical protein